MANFSDPTLKILWGKAGRRCSMCKADLVEVAKDGTNFPIGENAHIEGEKPGSPRYSKDTKFRNEYPNLILLCGTCHTKIDKNNGTDYSVDDLHKIKFNHEGEITDLLRRLVVTVSFAELEVLLSFLANNNASSTEQTLQLIPPQDKIKKNQISPSVENLLRIGLTQNKQVSDYLNKNPDMNFATKIREAFVAEYLRLKDEGYVGDSAYFALHDFASANHRELPFRTAAMTVVSYYFYLCEVFEK